MEQRYAGLEIYFKKIPASRNADYDNLCAPVAGIIEDTMIVFSASYTSNFAIWMSTDPKANEWKLLVNSFQLGGCICWNPGAMAGSALANT